MFAYVCEVGNLVHDFRMRHRDGGYRWLRDELRLVRPPRRTEARRDRRLLDRHHRIQVARGAVRPRRLP